MGADDPGAALHVFIDEAPVGLAMAGAIEDEDILIAVHQLGGARERKGQRLRRARRVRPAVPLVVGEDDRMSLRIEAVGEHAPRFTSFPPEHGVGVERDDDHIGVDHSGPLRLERG